MTQYKEYLVFTRLTPWQDWTMAAQADTPETAMLAAQIHRDHYLDDEADVLIAKYQDMNTLLSQNAVVYSEDEG